VRHCPIRPHGRPRIAFAIRSAFGRAAVAEPPREVIQKLAFFSAARHRLIQAHNLLAVPVAEQETFISKSLQKTASADRLKGNRSADAVKKSLAALKEEQKAVEKAIKEPHGRPRH